MKGEAKNVVGKVPKKVNFNDKTALLLDKKQKVFIPAEIVELAEILELDTSSSAAQRAQEAEAEAPN